MHDLYIVFRFSVSGQETLLAGASANVKLIEALIHFNLGSSVAGSESQARACTLTLNGCPGSTSIAARLIYGGYVKTGEQGCQKNSFRHWVAKMIIGVGVGLTGGAMSVQVLASGHLPPMPLPPRDFSGFADCLAYLQHTHDEDMRGTEDGDVALDGGGTRRKVVETKGIVQSKANAARYEAMVGWAIRGAPDEVRGYIETNFSYDHTVLTCDGPKLSGMRDSGYYLSGYERIPSK